MEVGRRIGVPLSGVGMPGHFLVRDKVDPSVFIDPFNGGRQLDAGGCRALHRAMAGAGGAVGPRLPRARRPPWRSWPACSPTSGSSTSAAGDIDSLRWVLRLRCAMPDATDDDRRELARLMAPLN